MELVAFMLTSSLGVLSWKCSGTVEKEDGMVPKLGKIPSVYLQVTPSSGKILDSRVRFVCASDWGISHLRSCAIGAPKGESPCSGAQTPSGMFAGWPVATSE